MYLGPELQYKAVSEVVVIEVGMREQLGARRTIISVEHQTILKYRALIMGSLESTGSWLVSVGWQVTFPQAPADTTKLGQTSATTVTGRILI